MSSNPASTDLPLARVLAERWSPVTFSSDRISQQEIDTLFEAARWAPSSFNEQPWRYFPATKDDGEKREKLESLLVDGNAWAKDAYLLILSFYDPFFVRNGKENGYASHDLGAASMSLVLQATHMGLVSHQMGGFNHEDANTILGIDVALKPGSMIAVGKPGESKGVSAERTRKERLELLL